MKEGKEGSVPLYARFEKEMDIFTRHIKILSLIYRKSPIGIVRLSRETGLPKHKVRYSLKILEKEGLIEAQPVGAVAVEPAEKFLKNVHELVSRFKKEFDTLERTIQLEMKIHEKKERG
ncbi:MAG TPA: winged helix-turn-helix transcriptional regulator [Thermoplasmata archaeon]|nr:winged helix-turn-helix transcriptional regulator [Thermoplasmata archaeon]